MKKTLAFLLVLILISGTLTVCFGKEINEMSTDVKYTLEKETGDRKYLEGIKVRTFISHDRILVWENLFDPLGETETELTFKKTGLPYTRTERFNRLDFLWYDFDFYCYENEEIKELINSAVEELTENGETKTVSIRMADYYDYYPVYFTLYLSDNYIQRFFKNELTDYARYISPGFPEDRADGFIEKLKDFIKIPVTEDDIREIKIEKQPDGHSYSMGHNGKFEFTSYNARFSDKIYFTFSNRTPITYDSVGVTVDTSHIPGGYGLYILPFGENDVYFEEMKNVYPIDKNSNILSLSADTENSLIYLMLWENGKYVVKIIDEKTMTDISSIELFDYTHHDWVHTVIKEDFSVFFKNDFEMKVIARNEDGTFSEVLHYTIPEENEYNWTNYPYDADYAFDGNRFIVCAPERDRYSSHGIFQLACGAELFVFTNNDLSYYGKWSCSLGEYSKYSYPFCSYLEDGKKAFIELK